MKGAFHYYWVNLANNRKERTVTHQGVIVTVILSLLLALTHSPLRSDQSHTHSSTNVTIIYLYHSIYIDTLTFQKNC